MLLLVTAAARLLAARPEPARRAETRAVTGVAVREVLAAAHLKICGIKRNKNICHHVKIFDLFTAGAVSVDGARAVAMTAIIAGLTDTLPRPGMTPETKAL